MRTTIRLPDPLLRQAKGRASATGRTLNAFIEDAVRAALARRGGTDGSATVPTLPSFRGEGLQPGIDLDDSATLLDVMDAYRQ